MISDIDDYFAKGCGRCDRFSTADCSTQRWQQGLLGLRKICLEVGLQETVKWGHPCYVGGGRNIAILGAFRGDFRMSFFNPALMEDPQGVLEKQGKNTQHPDAIFFRETEDLERLSETVRTYLREAISYAEQGIKQEKQVDEIELPLELLQAFENDTELAEAFQSLTPGRKRSYAINLNSAKQSKTRVARIAKFREKILAGKGALEY